MVTRDGSGHVRWKTGREKGGAQGMKSATTDGYLFHGGKMKQIASG